MTQNLSNGEQIVAITVYIPANFVFTSPTLMKVVVHEKSGTMGGGTGGSKTILHKLLVAIGIAKDPIVRGNIQTISVTVSDSKIPSKKIQGVEASGEVTTSPPPTPTTKTCPDGSVIDASATCPTASTIPHSSSTPPPPPPSNNPSGGSGSSNGGGSSGGGSSPSSPDS